jgi:hypothetical protein
MGTSHRSTFLALALVLVAACGSSKSGFTPSTDASVATDTGADARMGIDDGWVPPYGDAGSLFGDSGLPSADAAQVFDVEPAALQTITVPANQTMPTVVYKATLDGKPIKAAWNVDRGEVGSIGMGPSVQGVFTPTGTTGGLVDVIAGLNGQTLKRQVLVQITGTQNGANPNAPGESQQIPISPPQLGQGGGVGGVGGEGLGTAVSDPATLAALKNPVSSGMAQQLTFLYPYDKTVFPRGLLAPLLQWSWSTGDADAIQIGLKTTSGSFSWTGTFARPAILAQTMSKFIRHPIPQDIWAIATNSAGGSIAGATPDAGTTPDQLTVSLVVAKGGMAYGPISETWTIAPGRLEGTIYYNSYGTHLVKNSKEPSFGNGPQFGAAVLSIKEGVTFPSVVAGVDSNNSGSGCRVCHVVAAGGSRLIVQHGDNYPTTSSYALTNGAAVETVLTGYDNLFPWAALSPDGTMALTNGMNIATPGPNAELFPMIPTSTTPLTTMGLPAGVVAGTPAFSPDGKHVAFNFLSGTIGTTTGNNTKLVSLDYAAAGNAFTNLRVLATMPNTYVGGFPSFFPTNDAVVFQYQNAGPEMETWHNSQAQIWWSDLATGTQGALSALNGLNGTTAYLPTGANNHTTDTVLNFEPTVNPVASGGYIWSIFTSRRLYGNVATTDPYQSDPRNYDATQVANATCKKLWVAAIDLNAKPGTDPSHPAFYLPAQELLAGNSRGFWVLEPCRPDGATCMSGDQCCNGYCEPSPDGGLVCTNVPPSTNCSAPQEKCTTSADCCDKTNECINGFCSVRPQ